MVNRNQIPLHQRSIKSISSLFGDLTKLFIGFVLILVVTSGKPPAWLVSSGVFIGIIYVAYLENKRQIELNNSLNKQSVEKIHSVSFGKIDVVTEGKKIFFESTENKNQNFSYSISAQLHNKKLQVNVFEKTDNAEINVKLTVLSQDNKQTTISQGKGRIKVQKNNLLNLIINQVFLTYVINSTKQNRDLNILAFYEDLQQSLKKSKLLLTELNQIKSEINLNKQIK